MGVVRHLASGVAGLIYRPTDAIAEEYHKWYFNTYVWNKTTWMGVTGSVPWSGVIRIGEPSGS
jgi:cephalosporin hydroxylase